MRPAALVLWAALAATLGLTAWLAASDELAPVAAVAPSHDPSRGPGRALSVDAAAARMPTASTRAASAPAAAWGEPSAQALAAWSAPALTAAQPAARPAAATPSLTASSAEPAPRPPAPAFPYRWLGRLQDESGAQALLAGGERVLGVRAGEAIDSRWRLQRIDTAALQLVWLPAEQPVTVAWR